MKEAIKAMLLKAMKDKDIILRPLLRAINAEIANKEKTNNKNLDDAEIIAIIKREIKSLEETADMLSSLPDRENNLIEINYKLSKLTSLLPEQMSEEEVREKIDSIFSFSQFPNMGNAMKAILSTDLAIKADKALVAKLVKEKMNNARV